jgi:hypothetical protein
MASSADGARPRLEVFVLPGIGEIRAGDDLAAIILAAAAAAAATAAAAAAHSARLPLLHRRSCGRLWATV